MRRVFIREEPGRQETLAALAVSFVAGFAGFYLTRVLLSRTGIDTAPPSMDIEAREGDDTAEE